MGERGGSAMRNGSGTISGMAASGILSGLIRTPAPVPSAKIRLGVHRENRQVPLVRTVLDIVAGAVRHRRAMLNPPKMAEL